MKKLIVLALILLGVCSLPADAHRRGGAQKNDKTTLVGLNIGGMAGGSSVVPGVAGTNYFVPSLEKLQYYKSKNLHHIMRLPILWERAQASLGSALDTTYMGYVTTVADNSRDLGGCVLLDLHNYGQYDGDQINTPSGPTYAQYADFWRRIAQLYQGHKGVCGYDLMNEPHDMSDADVTFNMYQAAITAIREYDTTKPIYVEGDAYASTFGWMGNCSICGGAPIGGWNEGGNDQLKNLVDPADNLVFSGHAYGDSNGSGVYPDSPGDLFGDPACVDTDTWECAVAIGDTLTTPVSPLDTDIMVKRFTPFVEWCKVNGLKCHVGENGVPNDNPNWITALDKGIAYLVKNNIEYTYWNADGTSINNYPLNVDKRTTGEDALQMAVLTKYTNPHLPTTYKLSGPSRGDEDEESDPFTIQYNGYVEKPVTFTPSDAGAGGTFTPSSVTVQPGFNATATFTYTAPDEETFEISASNDQGWTVPAAVGYTTQPDVFAQYGVTPGKIISMQRIYSPYVGPCVTLRRASDNAVETFGWESLALNAKCDQSAITTWANGSNVYVVTLYDQSPNGLNWTAPVSDGSAVASPTNADQPRFVPNFQNGLPAVLWANSRMQTTSPINGLTGHSILAVYRPTASDSQVPFINYGWAIDTSNQISAFSSDYYTNPRLTPRTTSRMFTKSNSWSTVGVTWSTADGATVMHDGNIVNRTPAGGSAITQAYRSYATVGFPPFSANKFAGYSGEMITFQGKISDAAFAGIHNDQKSRWNTTTLPAYTFHAPTLEQNVGAENAPPWRGMGGTGGYPGFGLTPTASYAYWRDRGANIYRYVIRWEQLQKNLCTGDTTIDPTTLTMMDTAVAAITATGMDVLIDLHNYGTYNYNYAGNPTCAVPPDNGEISEPTTQGYFVDYWTQIAQHYASNPKVKFDIMNEPTAVTNAEMMVAAQAVIDSLRSNNLDNWVFVEFSSGSSACNRVAADGGPAFLAGINDPDDRTVLNCHQYITPCGYDACGAASNNGQGKSALNSATTYAKANGIKLFWGEAGIAAYSAQQYTETKNALDFIAANEDTGTGGWVGWNVWGAGTWGENYTFMQDPRNPSISPYSDRPTVRLLNTYFTGHSWPCADGSFGTAGVCPGTWPAAQFP